jgi:hypothetical protein
MTAILKGLTELVNAFRGLLEVLDKMAGGRIRGQIAFWVVFILIVAIIAWPAYNNLKSLLTALHITIPPSFFSELLIALGFALISVILLAAIGFGIGGLISAILTLFLGEGIERAKDDVLYELQNVIDEGRKLQTNFETKLALEKLYSRVQEIQEKQHKRVANRIIRWLRKRSIEKKERK